LHLAYKCAHYIATFANATGALDRKAIQSPQKQANSHERLFSLPDPVESKTPLTPIVDNALILLAHIKCWGMFGVNTSGAVMYART
jgi:hypothetical protein